MTQVEPRRQDGWRDGWFTLGLAMLCIVLAGVQVLLVLRNRSLTRRIGALNQRVAAAEREPLSSLEGRTFPDLVILDAAGREVGLADLPADHGTLLFVSSESCDYCEVAARTWDRLAFELAGSPVRVLGLVLDARPGDHDPGSSVYPLHSPRSADLAARFPGVPAAVLIDSSGVVREAVFGADQQGLAQAVDAFRTSLERAGGGG